MFSGICSSSSVLLYPISWGCVRSVRVIWEQFVSSWWDTHYLLIRGEGRICWGTSWWHFSIAGMKRFSLVLQQETHLSPSRTWSWMSFHAFLMIPLWKTEERSLPRTQSSSFLSRIKYFTIIPASWKCPNNIVPMKIKAIFWSFGGFHKIVMLSFS